MGPKLLPRRRQMMKGQHLQNEWHDDAEGCSVDQNLVSGKPEHAGNLQDLHETVRHGRRERSQAGPVPHVANADGQLFSYPEAFTGRLTLWLTGGRKGAKSTEARPVEP